MDRADSFPHSIRRLLSMFSLAAFVAAGCAPPWPDDGTEEPAAEIGMNPGAALSTSKWSAADELPFELSATSPAAAGFSDGGNKIMVVHQDGATSQLRYAISWTWDSGDFPLGGSSSSSPPALAFHSDGWLYMVYQSSSNELRMRSYSQATGWRTDTKIADASGGSILARTTPALASFAGKLHLVFNSPSNGQLYWSTFISGSKWTTPAPLSGKISFLAPALATFDNRLYLAYRNNANSDVMLSTYAGAGCDQFYWSGSFRIPGVQSGSAPALAADDFYGYLHLAHLAAGSSAIAWATFDGNAWSGDQVIPGRSSWTAPALAYDGTNVHLFHGSSDGSNRLWHAYFRN